MQTAPDSQKSIITCDLEGRIETFNPAASAIFGYAPDEVVGKKRVSLFSPGLTVLEHVPRWLSTAVRDGSYEGRTIFQRKDGTRFPAQIRITPTFKKGRQIGYCGITRPLPDTELEACEPRISFFTRVFSWAVITRAPFLTATVVPVLIGAAYARLSLGSNPFPWAFFLLSLVGAVALHVAANTFNDYFDWTSGTDAGNNDYFLPFSGGSRSIELGLITEQGLWRLSVAAAAVGVACGLALALEQGPALLGIGALGLFATYFYTAPPIRLAARRGLGELWVGLCFGPLMTGGVHLAMTGVLDPGSFGVGIPVGLLTAAILYINEFPDAESDARAGKNHLVVTLGKSASRWVYLGMVLGAFAALAWLIESSLVPSRAYWALASAPLALHALRLVFTAYESRGLVGGNRSTILLQLAFGLLMFGAMIF